MLFPVDEKHTVAAERGFGASQPDSCGAMKVQQNGGRGAIGRAKWWLHPVFDWADRKRIKRACNHILIETPNISEYGGFTENGLEVASNGGEDALLFLSGDGACGDVVCKFDHETPAVRKTKWTACDLSEKKESS